MDEIPLQEALPATLLLYALPAAVGNNRTRDDTRLV